MRRAPIVLVGTTAGLAAVLSFHTAPARLSAGSLPVTSTPTPSSGTTPNLAPKGQPPTSVPPLSPLSSETTGAPTTAAPATTSATGNMVNYSYGALAVAVTISGSRLASVRLASIEDGGNPRSESIDEEAVPLLEQEAVQVQSADIQGVSGASYTSEGFEQSLQSALTKVGFR